MTSSVLASESGVAQGALLSDGFRVLYPVLQTDLVNVADRAFALAGTDEAHFFLRLEDVLAVCCVVADSALIPN
jgi:hypothetical protein